MDQEKPMHTETEHEVATLLAHGASQDIDWLEFYKEVRAEVLKLREQMAQAPQDWEESVRRKLRQISDGTFGGRACMTVRDHNDGSVAYTLTTVAASNRPFLETTGPDFEAAFTKLFDAYKRYQPPRNARS